MTNPAIRVEHLGKRYQIGGAQLRYKTIRESLVNLVKNPFKKTKNPDENHIWALKDVSFEIQPGEVVGVIGRNGAGKSTLLKVLAHITSPTTGKVEIRGRIGSLLEVGTGFHQELTGRENIYLNGAVLGMKRAEIERKFDEIVDFAEIEKFLDTPVKHYSSGMYMRLAFAVAAHLEPEILLVDEVLAVGDAQFQKKCLGKMEDVAKGGRTVLFVSHNMGAIRSLCGHAVWLDKGHLLKVGGAPEIIGEYEESMSGLFNEFSYVVERDSAYVQNSRLHFSRVEVLDIEDRPATGFKYGEGLVLNVNIGGQLAGGMFSAEFYIYNELGLLVAVGASGPYHGEYFSSQVKRLSIEIGPLTITSGKYRISLSLLAGYDRVDTWDNAIGFAITECQPFRTGWEIPAYREGVCVLQQSFHVIE